MCAPLVQEHSPHACNKLDFWMPSIQQFPSHLQHIHIERQIDNKN